MSKSILFTIVLVFSATASGQSLKQSDFLKPQPIPDRSVWRSYGPMTAFSTSVCIGGAISDPLSSRGLYENNELFRNEQDQVRTGRGLIAGLAPCAASYFFERKHPKAANGFRFVYGGIKIGWAVRNLLIKRGRSR